MPSGPHGLPPGCGAASHSHGSVEASARAVGEPPGELAVEDAALGRAQGKASSGWAASSRSWACSRARALLGSLHGQTECTRSEIGHRVCERLPSHMYCCSGAGQPLTEWVRLTLSNGCTSS